MEVRPKKAPTRGPQVTIRLRTKKELELIKRGARLVNASVNTFAAEAMVVAAESAIKTFGPSGLQSQIVGEAASQ